MSFNFVNAGTIGAFISTGILAVILAICLTVFITVLILLIKSKGRLQVQLAHCKTPDYSVVKPNRVPVDTKENIAYQPSQAVVNIKKNVAYESR